MKRMLFAAISTVAAAAAFAAPANAQDIDVILPDMAVCNGQPVIDCAERTVDVVVTTVFYYARQPGPIIGGLCREVFGSCAGLGE
jgi:opacity protein-like surface antigen